MRLGAEDRHRSGMGHGGWDRAEADPFGDAESPRELGHRAHELAPSIVGLRTDEDQHVALVDPGPSEHQLGPGDLGQPPVDDLERRPARAVVEQRVGIECRHDATRHRRRRRAQSLPPSRRRPSHRRRRRGPARSGRGRHLWSTGSPAKDRRPRRRGGNRPSPVDPPVKRTREGANHVAPGTLGHPRRGRTEGMDRGQALQA